MEHVPCGLCGADQPRKICDLGLFGETVHTCVCPRCGLIYQTPRPGPEEMGRYYSDEYWERFDRRGRVTQESDGAEKTRAHRLDRARRRLAFLSAGTAGRALEIGCGEGETLLLLREQGWTVVGVEPSRDMAARARGRGLEVAVAPFESLDLEPGSFDLILHFHVLEHMADPLSGLRRMRGLLRDGGRMLLETPTLYRPRTKRLEDFLRRPHLFVFTPATLEPMLSLAGFAVTARDPDYPHMRWVCTPAVPGGVVFDAGEARRAKRWCRWWNAAHLAGIWRRRLGRLKAPAP